MKGEGQPVELSIEDDIEEAEVEALIALVDERIIEKLTRMIERMNSERGGTSG
jgi:hypothetical protein